MIGTIEDVIGYTNPNNSLYIRSGRDESDRESGGVEQHRPTGGSRYNCSAAGQILHESGNPSLKPLKPGLKPMKPGFKPQNTFRNHHISV